MNLLRHNKTYRSLLSASLLNALGASLMNLVFLVYASTYAHAKFYISLSAIIMILPILIAPYIGLLADRSQHKAAKLIEASWAQGLLYVLSAILITQKSVIIFVSLALINLLGDCLAQYKDGLRSPMIQKNISEENLQQAFGTIQSVSTIMTIVGQPLGILLLTVTNQSYQLVSLANALCYFLSGIILWRSRQHLTYLFLKSTAIAKHSLADAFQQLKKLLGQDDDKGFFILLGVIISINFVFAGIGPMLDLTMLDSQRWGLSYSVAIMLLNVVFSTGLVLGGLLTKDIFQKFEFSNLLLLILLLTISFCLTLNRILPLAILLLFMLSYTIAKINPKMQALLMANVPSEKLGVVGGSIQTIAAIGVPLGSVCFIFLTNLTTANLTLNVMAILTTLIFGILLSNSKRH
ncbi:MAG: MFS transporter [Streptococcaceae bacterium]|jgi:MFS family permease|nr:MFS transporter [Streptococcaceae bacterium]